MKVLEWDGKPIHWPGIYHNVPMEIYHSANACVEPSISSSGLRTIFNRSPAHYWVKSVYNPNRLEDEDESRALKFGRALHDLLFANTKFKKLYARRPETLRDPESDEHKPFHLGRNVCKAWMKLREQEGKTVLLPEEYDHLVGIGQALGRNAEVQSGALNGKIEYSMFWKDQETGVWLKARPDVIPTDGLIFVDLKTTRDVRYKAIIQSIIDYGYAQQGALIMEGCQALFRDWAFTIKGETVPFKKIPQEFWLLFAEKEPPYSIQPVQIDDYDLGLGAQANRTAIRKFAKGLSTGKWPGPAGEDEKPIKAELPEWARESIKYRLEMM